MKSYRKELHFRLPARRGLVNITPQVEEALRESGIKEGLLLANAMNITASVFVNDDESGLHHDYEVWLEKLAPEKPYAQYRHNGCEDNADAHLKRTVMGRETVVAVTDTGFTVSIIPHTQDETTLVKKKIGDVVNLENDVIAKYVEKLMRPAAPVEPKGGLTLDFLLANGF